MILALATLTQPSRAAELYGGLGTSGVEVGIGERVGGRVSLRMSGEFLRVSRDFESDGATYDTKLKLRVGRDSGSFLQKVT